MHGFNERTLYGESARFNSAQRLDNDSLRRLAPSIFAVEAHESRSERFQPIPTIQIVDALRNEGFFPVNAKQQRTRDVSKRDFTTHLIRFRRFDNLESYRVNDTLCEVILKNANDGTARYELMSGLFRVLCLNSLVAQTATIDSVKVRHMGKLEAVRDNVIEGTYKVLAELKKCLQAPAEWSRLPVPVEAKVALANAAHMIRFGANEDGTPQDNGIAPEKLLRPMRREDDGPDLWRTWNRTQEHCIRGGDQGVRYGTDERGRVTRRRVTTRQVNGIHQDISINKALWMVGEQLFATLTKAQNLAQI